MKTIDTRIELATDCISPGTMHGWHSSRLLAYGGALYFMGSAVQMPDVEDLSEFDERRARGQIFRRDMGEGGKWEHIADLPQRPYTSVVDPQGCMWMFNPMSFSYVTIYRSAPKMDLTHFHRMYDGTCFYGGTGMSPEGNFLVMHALDTNHTPRFPNAQICQFYEAETDSWHSSRLETPEGRFGYIGIILRGRSATALLQSTIFDPEVAPELFGYNWRILRIAHCDDLTTGEWKCEPMRKRKFGSTNVADMTTAPDGTIYVAYQHQGGDENRDATEALPKPTYISRLGEDLSYEHFELELPIGGPRMYWDSKGQCYLVARLEEDTPPRLWRVDPDNGFKIIGEWLIEGAQAIQGYILHTLRPARFGGHADGNTVHIVSAERHADYEPDDPAPLTMSHLRFDLPIDQ